MKGKRMNAVRLLEKYLATQDALAVVYEHSRLVADKALAIADALGDLKPDRTFIEEAALLHDIGVGRTASPHIHCHGTEPYIRHGIIGREILETEGFPRHALVCERHVGVGLTIDDIHAQRLPLPLREMTPISLEERIISYADMFFSKKAGAISVEKTPEQVRENLRRFGGHKVVIFDEWLAEFDCRADRL
jgi:uncharacterized protein